MRGIDLYKDGVLIARFSMLKDAAEYLELSSTTVKRRIDKEMVVNGYRYAYNDNIHNKPKFKLKKAESTENLSRDEAEQIKEKFKERGFELDEIHYEARNNIEITTICGKLEFERPVKVGSAKCMECRFFRGRVKMERIVLCSYYAHMKSIHRKRDKRRKTNEQKN